MTRYYVVFHIFGLPYRTYSSFPTREQALRYRKTLPAAWRVPYMLVVKPHRKH